MENRGGIPDTEGAGHRRLVMEPMTGTGRVRNDVSNRMEKTDCMPNTMLGVLGETSQSSQLCEVGRITPILQMMFREVI